MLSRYSSHLNHYLFYDFRLDSEKFPLLLLELHKDQDIHQLAANLRRAFSGIVAGNVKEEGILAIEKYGKFEISGDEEIMSPLDDLLTSFVEQQRMKLPGSQYIPCYEIVK